jgi:hypothetical protein
MHVNYWEIITDNLGKSSWSWGCISAGLATGERSGLLTRIPTTEKRFIVHADEKLTAFMEPKSAIRMSDAPKNGRLSHFRPEHLKGRLAGNPATG